MKSKIKKKTAIYEWGKMKCPKCKKFIPIGWVKVSWEAK